MEPPPIPGGRSRPRSGNRGGGILFWAANTKGRNRRISTGFRSVYTVIRARHGAKIEIYDAAIPILILGPPIQPYILFLLIAFQGKCLLNFLVMCLKIVEGLGAAPIIEIYRGARSISFGNELAPILISM